MVEMVHAVSRITLLRAPNIPTRHLHGCVRNGVCTAYRLDCSSIAVDACDRHASVAPANLCGLYPSLVLHIKIFSPPSPWPTHVPLWSLKAMNQNLSLHLTYNHLYLQYTHQRGGSEHECASICRRHSELRLPGSPLKRRPGRWPGG